MQGSSYPAINKVFLLIIIINLSVFTLNVYCNEEAVYAIDASKKPINETSFIVIEIFILPPCNCIPIVTISFFNLI